MESKETEIIQAVDYSEQLDSINASMVELLDYLKEQDKLQAEELQKKEQAEKELAAIALEEEQAAGIVAKELEEQAIQEQQIQEEEEKQFRLDMLQGLEHINGHLQSLNGSTLTGDQFTEYRLENAALLESLGANTTVSEFENQVASAGYYADIGLILLVFGVAPVYLAYRFVKPFGALINSIL